MQDWARDGLVLIGDAAHTMSPAGAIGVNVALATAAVAAQALYPLLGHGPIAHEDLATIQQLHANTVEVPIAWEQIEPIEGHFDFSFLDTLLRQARENDVRLVLLWFGTWKNTGPNYAPEWVKADTNRFPRMRTRERNCIASGPAMALSP